MTLEEIKREAAVLPSEERLRLTAFLKHLERADNAANTAPSFRGSTDPSMPATG